MADKVLYLVGCGPLLGRELALVWSRQRYHKVALFARRAEQLDIEAARLSREVDVKTCIVDVTDTAALNKAFDAAEAALGKPECILYNAARVKMSTLLQEPVEDIEYDYKINVSALYNVVRRYMPHLTSLRQQPDSWPSLIVPSSLLHDHPHPAYFALSLVKAAQRNLMKTLNMTYAGEGVAIGLINVGGIISHDSPNRNPKYIAENAWEWFEKQHEDPSFETKIGYDF